LKPGLWFPEKGIPDERIMCFPSGQRIKKPGSRNAMQGLNKPTFHVRNRNLDRVGDGLRSVQGRGSSLLINAFLLTAEHLKGCHGNKKGWQQKEQPAEDNRASLHDPSGSLLFAKTRQKAHIIHFLPYPL
jgi:hypothetical protein